jgi:hypothetical protein
MGGDVYATYRPGAAAVDCVEEVFLVEQPEDLTSVQQQHGSAEEDNCAASGVGVQGCPSNVKSFIVANATQRFKELKSEADHNRLQRALVRLKRSFYNLS